MDCVVGVIAPETEESPGEVVPAMESVLARDSRSATAG